MDALPEFENDDPIRDKQETKADDEEQAGDLVEYFYECINAQKFEEAYSLLGKNWQARLPFDEFRSGYSNTLQANVHHLKTNSMGSRVEVTFTITAEELEDEGNIRYQDYYMTYQVGYENGQMTILTGSSSRADS